ncbi:hypothetical protein DCAR_0314257 [Daucus carota subsp. sativus]|uniref:Uncharacterized protein n=1 Tax=Daucus carota subsp. sativus TaxID=79200 RepID=A0A169WFE4_DAUCS|nr:hypothetical protein DCAR_0314257 [Daucus carota subsp. sativus]
MRTVIDGDQNQLPAADSHVAPAPVGYPTKDGDAAPAASGPVETQSRDGLSDCAKSVLWRITERAKYLYSGFIFVYSFMNSVMCLKECNIKKWLQHN